MLLSCVSVLRFGDRGGCQLTVYANHRKLFYFLHSIKGQRWPTILLLAELYFTTLLYLHHITCLIIVCLLLFPPFFQASNQSKFSVSTFGHDSAPPRLRPDTVFTPHYHTFVFTSFLHTVNLHLYSPPRGNVTEYIHWSTLHSGISLLEYFYFKLYFCYNWSWRELLYFHCTNFWQLSLLFIVFIQSCDFNGVFSRI